MPATLLRCPNCKCLRPSTWDACGCGHTTPAEFLALCVGALEAFNHRHITISED